MALFMFKTTEEREGETKKRKRFYWKRIYQSLRVKRKDRMIMILLNCSFTRPIWWWSWSWWDEKVCEQLEGKMRTNFRLLILIIRVYVCAKANTRDHYLQIMNDRAQTRRGASTLLHMRCCTARGSTWTASLLASARLLVSLSLSLLCPFTL